MPVLDAGSYVVYANYSGDSNYAPARDSLTITVNKAVNNILVFGDDGVYLENSTIVVVADVVVSAAVVAVAAAEQQKNDDDDPAAAVVVREVVMT